MNEIFQAALLVIATSLICVLLRSIKPEFSFFAGAAGALAVLILSLPMLRSAVEGIGRISMEGELGEGARQCIRAMAIVVVCEFSAALCKDAGQNALAGQISFFGRAALCALCIPVFAGLLASFSSFALPF